MLPKNQRLKKNSAFSATYRLKKSVASALFFLHVGKLKEDKNYPTKTGFVISKKVHKHAVKRNKLKRRLREAFRNLQKEGLIDDSSKFLSLIFIARGNAFEADYKKVYHDVKQLVEKANSRFGERK